MFNKSILINHIYHISSDFSWNVDRKQFIMENIKLSRLLSKVLRHKPESLALKLDKQGWTSVEILLEKLKDVDMEQLQDVVATNNKKRFEFSEDGTKIRASQGHSINIELGYKAVTPPDTLLHGTATKFLPSILVFGLNKGKRHHVHLSKDTGTASSVGLRHGKLVILQIDSAAMHKAGYKFYVSKNGVWLTDEVPTRYITQI